MTQDIKKPEASQPPAPRYPDPFGAMRAEMDRVFDNFLGGGWGSMPGLPGLPGLLGEGKGAMVVPSVDVRENDTEIVVEAELPGMEQDDVDISLRDGVLTVKGEKKSERVEDRDDVHVAERSYGSFSRSFRLPETVDEENVAAALDNGVLRVTLPKRAEAVKAEKKIKIGKR